MYRVEALEGPVSKTPDYVGRNLTGSKTQTRARGTNFIFPYASRPGSSGIVGNIMHVILQYMHVGSEQVCG